MISHSVRAVQGLLALFGGRCSSSEVPRKCGERDPEEKREPRYYLTFLMIRPSYEEELEVYLKKKKKYT